MPQYTFDVTDKCIKYVSEVITPMPGNAGQVTLVESLKDTAYGNATVTVTVDEEGGVDIESSGQLYWKSNHPEAVEIIIKTAEDNSELIIDQAGIAGPFSLAAAVSSGDWKILGLDGGSYEFKGVLP